MLDDKRDQRLEIGERRERAHVDGEVVHAEPERGDPRRVLALGQQRCILAVRDAPRAARPGQVLARAEASRELGNERGDLGLRRGGELVDEELADEELREVGIGVLPVARPEMLLGEAVVVARFPAERLERPG